VRNLPFYWMYMTELTFSNMFSVQTSLEEQAQITQGINLFLNLILPAVMDSMVDTISDYDTKTLHLHKSSTARKYLLRNQDNTGCGS
jgi:hypothetical protein